MESGRRRSSRQRNLGSQDNGEKSQKSESGSAKIKAKEQHSSVKKSSVPSKKEKKNPAKVKGRYPLRSAVNVVRTLRSTSKKVDTTNSTPASTAEATVPIDFHKDKRKQNKRVRRAVKDEFFKIRRHVRYFLHRMDYEQSLIDAYSNEGWRGQSLEKIRPEKELERAKSEILRCKLSIRNQFQHLDSLISEGKLDDSLFDSEGQIDSEDIACAKCGSKQLGTNNDIILCDGVCDRGFHQKCLTPPLLNEDIPPGDEGWLCPACDCKLDCIDFINEAQVNNLLIEDEWEKVFPEAAAVAAGDTQYDELELPSDDSEDDDYAPDAPELHQQGDGDGQSNSEGSCSEGSDSDGSDSQESFTSEEPLVPNNVLPSENNGFPSDDSEDDDYDPDKPNYEEKSQGDVSMSDDSDFTSDTDDLTNKFPGSTNEFTSDGESGKRKSNGDEQEPILNAQLHSSMEPNLGQDDILLASKKRERGRLDYKKIYEDTYGGASSDSSEDEDWDDKDTANKVKKGASEHSSLLNSENTSALANQRAPRMMKDNSLEKNSQSTKGGLNKMSRCRKSKGSVLLRSEGSKNSPSVRKHFSPTMAQKLQESFNENQYPDRVRKEHLANELGITPQQVAKWFEHARRSFRVSAKEQNQADNGTKNVNSPVHTPSKSPSPKSGQRNSTGSVKCITSDTKTPTRDDTPAVSPVRRTPAGARSITSGAKTPTLPSIEHDKVVVNFENNSNGHLLKTTPISARNSNSIMKTPASVGMELDTVVSSHYNSNKDQKTPVAPAGGAMVHSNGQKTQETATPTFDRQKLVLRELRKRRRGL